MRFLQVGLGSMGRRRVRCLQTLGETDITAFDLRPDRREEAARLHAVETVGSFEEGLAKPGLDAVIVSTPPDQHHEFVKAAIAAGKHTFCEANIVTEGADEIAALADAAGVVAAPSATMRFHPIYGHLHRLAKQERVLGRPLILDFHLGNYILDWHPWEGLDFYAGRKATGAGREMVPFEFEWMQWIFGPVDTVQCTHGRQLDLPTDLDDTYCIVARFQSGLLATVLIEVIARPSIREGRLVSQKGTISWDFDSARLSHYDAETGTYRVYKASEAGFNLEQMYVLEMAAWLRACRGEEPWSHTYGADRELGRVLLACEKSSQTGNRVRVREVEA